MKKQFLMIEQSFNAKAIIDMSKFDKGVYITAVKDKEGRT